MDCLIHPCYFPNIAHFLAMYKANTVHLEVCDNYQKQTYRNRTEIYGANGKLSLTVPVIYSQTNRKQYKDVQIFNSEKWQQQHLKSLTAAYSTSPFFEYYIDDLMPLFTRSFTYILDLNLLSIEFLQNALQLDVSLKHTKTFEKTTKELRDRRHLVNPKEATIFLTPYTQVFSNKHGFISNLSILDVLFNEGPATELYLSKQQLYK
ncbi:WbqC family protein [Winogradskyella sp. DF17]|uniref:WbqC family protein n=1 Tax=Winogradskyella pelagia TaxID=2819984 RepID=A0ABS3T2Z7_9FLAO|nr:WbqC family protein [Winogradskyella sp. DF17]MBO3116649.1 WbqC family protein [Winogradskyella sp. DF17]